MIEKGEWVRIHKIVLQPSERNQQIPEDTKQVPLEMWGKGFLQKNAEFGDEVTVKTITGRVETGTLVEESPYNSCDPEEVVPELLSIGKRAWVILFGDDEL